MNVLRIIAYIVAAIFIFFGVLFIWGAFSPQGGGTGWILIGIITVGIGLGLIWLGSRFKPAAAAGEQNVTYKIDLPADVNADALVCNKCGGALTTDNIKMVAGAPVVNCPYCGTTYQLTEEPKW
jgi:hypothetical protein